MIRAEETSPNCAKDPVSWHLRCPSSNEKHKCSSKKLFNYYNVYRVHTARSTFCFKCYLVTLGYIVRSHADMEEELLLRVISLDESETLG